MRAATRYAFLRDRLKAIGKNQSALARHFGASPAQVTHIINGRRRIQIEELPAIAAFLDWPVETLLAKLLGFEDLRSVQAPAGPPGVRP